MFRTYRDPYKMQDNLKAAQEAYEEALETHDPEKDVDYLVDLQNEVEYWREQANFAWQDEEASEAGWDY